jgi:polysaccharide biosynthesis protein PslH
MKLLWVKTDFLHPTDRGGQIRTLETLRRLHERHEVHYLAYDNLDQPEGLARAKEYCSFAYPVEHRIVEKTSPAFAAQLVAGLVSPLPVAAARWKSKAFEQQLKTVLAKHTFDSISLRLPVPAPNFQDLSKCTLFQHNVEAMIWDRHAQRGRTMAHRWYFRMQASRMAAYERELRRAVRNVIAVSEADAVVMREKYGAKRVDAVPTGVDTDFFQPPPNPAPMADLVFLGSMDWMPNIDGMQWFVEEIWPLIRARRPETTLAIVGRKPVAAVQALAGKTPGITVTGTVPDVRPWLHGAKLSIVPLRIGGARG